MERTNRCVLSPLRRLVTWERGQNYPFNGCMAYLMERLGEDPRFDYWFFTVVTGETFTQVHRNGCAGVPGTLTYGLSQMAFDEAFVRQAFDACGYDVDLVDAAAIRRDPAAQFERIACCIDRGLPVIAKGFAGVEGAEEAECGRDFCTICGYDRDRQSLLLLCWDLREPLEQTGLLDAASALLFVGDKKHAPPIEALYRQAIEGIPACLTRPAQNGATFGRQAFVDWADSLVDGSLAAVPADALDVWDCHGVYLCILGTNCYVRVLLTQLYQTCPALADQADLIALTNRLSPLYEQENVLFHELLELEGGFGVPAERLRDPAAMRPVAEKIRALVDCCDRIMQVFRQS